MDKEYLNQLIDNAKHALQNCFDTETIEPFFNLITKKLDEIANIVKQNGFVDEREAENLDLALFAAKTIDDYPTVQRPLLNTFSYALHNLTNALFSSQSGYRRKRYP